MNDEPCAELRLLIQADLDGELSPAEAAKIAGHLADCPDCAALGPQLQALSGRLRREVPYHAASPRLRAAVLARIAAAERPRRRAWWRSAPVPLGAGFALAAGLALLLLGRGGGEADLVVEDHIRALQPGHMLDVASSDQHNVKPWFDGRIDFAPTVKDLKSEGFPLTGGRLDYLDGRAVAALVYARRLHRIDLFIWPDRGAIDTAAASGSHQGYNFRHWRQGGMVYWAVSDLNAVELGDFVRLWQQHG